VTPALAPPELEPVVVADELLMAALEEISAVCDRYRPRRRR
jgi:hypothetical protein